MKVIHVLKKIEDIDQDIRELKKLEKSVKKNKSFTTPIYMSIEKQINILLGERIKLLELRIENPPESLNKEIEGEDSEQESLSRPAEEPRKEKKETKAKRHVEEEEDDEIRMLTQDQIDAKIRSMAAEKGPKANASSGEGSGRKALDDSVKILDIALEQGTLVQEPEGKKDKEKKVKFFRDNFPES